MKAAFNEQSLGSRLPAPVSMPRFETDPAASPPHDEGADMSPREALTRLLDYCRKQNYAGHDPYDGLNSRLFRSLPTLRNWPLARLAWIQFFKRCPVNLRSFVGVPRSQNPKGIALFLSAFVRLQRLGLVTEAETRALAERLLELRSPGQRHASWGYNFDWQNRHHLFAFGTPNIICTTFAGQALLDAYETFEEPVYLDVALDAARFLLDDLERTPDGDAFCFSYTPLYPSTVHNASLLGAAFLARLHFLRPAGELQDAAIRSARYSIRRQAPDGSWPYGEHPSQQWIDSFHTGYNLLALRDVARCTGMNEADVALRKGFIYYRAHFFQPDGVVKYYHNRMYPIDVHGVAHAIVALSELRHLDPGNLDLADAVVEWAAANLQSSEGWFYYQKWPRWTNRIPYMRWGQAWMLLALAVRGSAEQ